MSDAGYAAFHEGQPQPRRYRDTATGEECERTLTDHEEVMSVTNGHLEIVDTARYVVCGDNKVFDLEPGEEFTASLTRHQEKFLVGGGFVRKLDEDPEQEPEPEAPTPPPAKKQAATRRSTKEK